MRARTVWTGIAALSVVVLAACSSGHGTRGSATAGSNGGGSAGSGPMALPAASAAPTGPSVGTDSVSGSGNNAYANGGGAASSTTLLDSRALIRTAEISVRVKSIDAADHVRMIATGAGGQIDGDDRVTGDSASATMVLEVPPAALNDVLANIAKLGTELGRQLSTKDVTTQVADVNSRVKSAQDSIARLRLLFTQATKVGDIIAIEGELSSREADLESMQAQQRMLAAQTEMAQVTVDLSTVAKPEKKKHERGFIGGIKRGWDNFTSATVSVLTGLGIAGPFAVLLMLVGAGGTVLVRRRRANESAATATPETT